MIFADQLKDLAARIGVAIKNLSISDIGGLVAALSGKVDDSQVLTDVPSRALFTDTDTLQSVTSKGSSTNRDITVNGIVDQITNIGKTGDVSRAQIQSYFPEGGGPEKWAEIPIGTRLFIYNGDIPDSYNPPENKGVFHKISHADSAGRWTGMYYPISDYHNNIYIGQGSNSQNPTWAKLWTDRTLTEVSQLINDAGYLVNADKYDDTIIQSEVTDNTDARHSHLNKTTLDSFGENVNGLPTYNGVKVDTTVAQRDVYDGLDSTDNTISLSANNGKTLFDELGGKSDKGHKHGLIDINDNSRIIFGDSNSNGVTRIESDLNTISKSGFYFSGGSTLNKPPGNAHITIHSGYDVNNIYGFQLSHEHNADNLYVRRKTGVGTFAPWRTVFTHTNQEDSEVWVVAFSDESTVITEGNNKVEFQMPNYPTNLTGVSCSLKTAPSESTMRIDLNENGNSVLSTKITINSTEKTSETAASPPVISNANLAANAVMTVDIDTPDYGGTSAGGKLMIYWKKT